MRLAATRPTAVNLFVALDQQRDAVARLPADASADAMRACLRETALVGRICFDARFYPPDRRGRDLDNCFKVLIDAIADSGIIDNDKNIKEIHAVMMPEVFPNGQAIVELSELPDVFA